MAGRQASPAAAGDACYDSFGLIRFAPTCARPRAAPPAPCARHALLCSHFALILNPPPRAPRLRAYSLCVILRIHLSLSSALPHPPGAGPSRARLPAREGDGELHLPPLEVPLQQQRHLRTKQKHADREGVRAPPRPLPQAPPRGEEGAHARRAPRLRGSARGAGRSTCGKGQDLGAHVAEDQLGLRARGGLRRRHARRHARPDARLHAASCGWVGARAASARGWGRGHYRLLGGGDLFAVHLEEQVSELHLCTKRWARWLD